MTDARTKFCFQRAQTEVSVGCELTWMVIQRPYLPAHSCYLAFIHTGFCHHIRQRASGQVLHDNPQLISHKVAAGKHTRGKKEWLEHRKPLQWVSESREDTRENISGSFGRVEGSLLWGEKNKIWRTESESTILRQLGIYLGKTKRMWSMKSQTLKLRTQG